MKSSARQANPDDIDILVIWNAVQRNLGRLLLWSGAIAAGAYLALSMMTPQYSSQAQILIEDERAGFKGPSGSQGARQERRIDMEAVKSQAQILQSNDLAHQVAKKLKLNLKPEFNSALGDSSFLAMLTSTIGLKSGSSLPESERVMKGYYKRLTVYPIKESRHIAVEFRSSKPELAASLANELSKTYLEFLQSARVDQNKGARKWLGQEIDLLRKDVELAETKLEKLRTSSGLIPGQNNVTLNVQQLGEINSRLSLAKAQKSEAVARARLIRQMLAEGAIDTAPDVLKSRLIQRLNEQRVRVERQIAELSATLLPRHPRMAQLRSELSGLRRQIRKEALKLVKGLENEAKIAGAKEASLLASINTVRKSTVSQSDTQAKIRVLEREAKSKRELYESYVSRLGDASARQSRLSVPVMARITQKATVSSIPVFPKKGPIAILAFAATFFLGLVLIVTRELIAGARNGAQSHRSPAAVYQAPITATPVTAAPVKAEAPMATAASATVAPASSETAQPVQTTVISSMSQDAQPCENPNSAVALSQLAERLAGGARIQGIQGYRTLVASEENVPDGARQVLDLARKLSASRKSVVLLDWEEGANSLAQIMNMPHEPGLHDLIEGRAGFKDVLHPVPETELHLIPAGKSSGEIDPDTEKSQLELILDALDETYDHIVAYGGYDNAQELFRITEGRFDAGITICSPGGELAAQAAPDSFLGYRVEGIDVQHFVPAASEISSQPDKSA